MKIAICDDNQKDRQLINSHLVQYGTKNKLEVERSFYDSGESLLAALKKVSFQVIFLDVYMLELNGIDTAREIRKFDKNVQIIFITTSSEHAVSSYEVRALHYLIKPVSYIKFEKALNLCQFETVKASRQVELLTGKSLSPIKLSEIIYAEMYKKVLTVYTTYGKVESRTSLEGFEQLLGGVPFLRCHRSIIVNMDFITNVKGDDFLINDNEIIPISRPSRVLTLKTYHEYVFSGMREKL